MERTESSLQAVGLIAQGVELLFFFLIIVFILHAAILTYHWFSYGQSRALSLTALALYLGGAAILFMTMSTAMLLL